MHVDGAGVIGMKHSPYYPEFVTDEPAGHLCLALKNTFAKIHGFGKIVYQSYPIVEKQGGNLIAEVIIRSLKTYLVKTGKPCLRNVYVYLDNTNANKCRTLLSAMSALVLLGNVIKDDFVTVILNYLIFLCSISQEYVGRSS